MDIFNQALEMPEEERGAHIRRACAGDAELAAEVSSLITSHDEDPEFLDRPVARVQDVMETSDEEVEPLQLDRYRVVRLLGRGGMGDVYLAMEERGEVRRPVAVKVIRRGMDTDEVLRRFRTEERILATLRHPNIAQLLDGGATGDGRPYLVMEFIEGRPIDVFCDEAGLDLDERLRLFVRVCDAVQHAHRNLVVHRDLKPANILVTESGDPKLLDFGIGKLLDPDDGSFQATRTGHRLLTPAFASPEQVRGEVASASSDVYQLGVLLYVLLTGHRPHGDGETSASAVERAVLQQEPPRPSAVVDTSAPGGRRLRRRLGGDLDTIVLTALRKEPERRYLSAAALAEDLGRHLRRVPIRARPDTFGYRAGKFLRRNRLTVAAAAVVALALAGAGANTVSQSRRVARERDEALEVRNFLLEMFGSTAPDQATGDTVTARQLLDVQAANVDAAYGDRPRLQARMLGVLAEGYDRLGLLDEAEPLVRRSLDLRLEAMGEGEQETADSRALLGWILHEKGETAQGRDLLRQAVATMRAVVPLNEPALARALNDLGVTEEALGEYDDAEALYDEALERRRRLYGARHRAVAVTASNLSVIRYRRADYTGAVQLGEEALHAMRAAVGPDHQRSLLIQSNLAAMKMAMWDVDGAEAEYRDLVERQVRLRGPEDLQTLRFRSNLGAAVESQQRWAESEAIFTGVLEAQVRRLGPDHPQVAATRVRVARALDRQDRTREALPLLDEALATLREAVGDEHPVVAQATEALAEVHAHLGDVAVGERLHRDALAILTGALGEEHPQVVDMRIRLGHLLLSVGELDGGWDELAASEAILGRMENPPERSLHSVQLHMARARYAQGRMEAADSLLHLAEDRSAGMWVAPNLVEVQEELRARLEGR